ncbi:MAG: phosphate ABC transporter permease PtsA [Thermoprotei archaeon]|nr:MAG: phosphate ABC transporter permease PtsA [Thermoprotei archaeon]
MIIRKIKDKLFTLFAIASFIIVSLPLFHIILTIIVNGIGAINLEFFIALPNPPGVPGGGIVNAIEGSIILVCLTMLISFPIGFFGGIYLAEYGKGPLAETIRNLTNSLSGIPSIVAGIFSYTLIVIYFGFSALAGAIALSLLAIPYIVRTTEEALKAVPNDIREAGLALGLPRWKVTLYLVVAAAKPRILAGTLLAVARLIGEAAPLLFTAFGNPFYTYSIFEPTDALPLLIFNYALSPYPDWHLKAWGAALVLIIIVLSINLTVKYYVQREGK